MVIKAQPKTVKKGRKKIFYGWWIVAISAVIDAMKHGTFNRGFSFYVIPLTNELGIGVAAIALAEMFGRLEGGLQGPLAGYMTDRLGPRVVLAAGGITSGLGFILLYFTHSYFSFMLVFVGLLSLGFRGGYNNASVPALNQWFRRRRSLAMSTASIGTGLGGLMVAPLIGILVVTLGWRQAAMVSGIAIMAVVLPLSYLVKKTPESMGLYPDGDDGPGQETAGVTERDSTAGPSIESTRESTQAQTGEQTANPTAVILGESDFTAREATRTASFWLLVWAVGLRNTVHSGMQFLLVPVMVWFLSGSGRGDTESQSFAILFVAVLSLCTMVFNPLVGWIGDSWSKQRLSAVAMVSGGFALMTLLNHSGMLWQLGIFVVLMAFSESANPLAWAIMGDFFGRRSFGTLRGIQHLPDQLMSMSTAVWMGWIFDRTGSFYWALLPLIGIYGLSAFFYWTMPRPKPPIRVAAPVAAS